ncbi:MAG: hypothetical protein JWQ64_2686, partial [Subtercola sp.]|nr:hypothetical protein [Subtercola sp.]
MDVAVEGQIAHPRIGAGQKVKAYVALTKPRVME